VATLIDEFLEIKRHYGSPIEKRAYKGMTASEFIERLILKRPLSFMGPKDETLARDNKIVRNARRLWPLVGTEKETKPLVLKDSLSYDEIPISALLGVSSATYFIHSGRRGNESM
jgi:hypothetical protein